MRLWLPSEEIAIGNAHHQAKHRGRAHHWPQGAIWFGFAIVLWSILIVRAPLPQQDPPVARPEVVKEVSSSSGTSTSTESIEESTSQSALIDKPKLYLRRPDIGEKIGTVTLESLDLSWPIFEGTDEAQLSRGVGHYSKSVLPGMDDNTILSGHRNTVFNRLGELERGDLILVRTQAGVFSYRVDGFRVVSRSDQTVIMPSDTGTLTLTTCYPFNNIGTTTDAYIVSATLVNSAPRAATD